MTSILHLVTNVTATSIPVELAEALHEQTPHTVAIASFYDGPYYDNAENGESFDVRIIPLGGAHRLDAAAFRQLRALLSEFDILHTHQNFLGSTGRAVASGTGTKIVDTEHNDHRGFSHLQNVVNAPTLVLADSVIANSRATRDSFRWYERPFIGGSKTEVIYNGVNIARVDEQEPAGRFGDVPTIITAGRLVAQKNYATLIRSLSTVLKAHPDTQLVIIGDGPRREELEQVAHNEGVAEHVTFTGFVPTRGEVYQLLKDATVFAMPSHYEGFCVAAVEAMACQLPVVASDISVLTEVVGSGGVFADQTEPLAFGDAIVELLDDPTARRELAQNGRRRATETLSLARCVEAYSDLYERLV